MINETILHYKILEKLGEGGMGVVYKAKDTKLKRDVAIKFLPHHIAADKGKRERFKIEAQAAAALNHPNIATIHNIEEVNDELFIVMEYIEGRELKGVVGAHGDAPMRIDDVINYATQIVSGLQAAHKKEITHRDIKSSNIMITKEGQVKIMDFGLAKVRGGAQVTKTGTTIGTAAYMSPEQADKDEVDHRADIWSFGVVLYEMLTGQLPFNGGHEMAIMYSILNKDPTPVSELRERVPKNLQQIIQKAMTKGLEARYQNVGDILDDLKSDGGKTAFDMKAVGTRRTVLLHKRVFLFSGISALILLLTGYFFLGRRPIATERVSIAVVDFVNETNEPELDGLSGMLITSLEQSRRLSVLTRTRMFDILKQIGKQDVERIDESLGWEVCRRANVSVLATATVSKFGKLYVIDLKVFDVPKNEHLLTAREQDEGQESVLAMLDKLSKKTRKGLKESAQELADANRKVKSLTTPHLEAYRHYFQGENLFSKFKFQEAAAEYQKAIAIDSMFALAYYRYADMYGWDNWTVNEDRKKKQLDILKKIPDLNRIPEKERYLAEILNAELTDGFHASLKIARAAETRFPDDKEVLFQIADASFHIGDHSTAVDYFEKILKMYPEFQRVFFHLGESYQATGHALKAIEAAKQLARIDEKWGSLMLSALYYWQEDYGLAVLEAQKVLQTDSTHFMALHRMVWSYRNDGKYDKALTYARKLVAAHPQVSPYRNLGHIYLAMDDTMKARMTYERAVDLFPNSVPRLLNSYAGNLKTRRADYEGAIAKYLAVLAIDSTNATALSGLLLAYRDVGDFEKAIQYGKKAIALGASADRQLAFVYLIKGDTESAVETYHNYLENNPENI